ncbi:MAG TPA: tRNA 4-thiouridine(8) synthase ThiI [Candidatus Omnitrophota bacterium]|nr:tRNA 4-thiouridine(8) synthase ThiI [Candidatus Omnitrophota bacterium]
MIKAISLYSGGLDSILARRIMSQQGIDVIAVNFVMPFGCSKKSVDKDIEKVDITNDFLEILKAPAHGYGSNMNPCIDCKILMLKKAKKLMEERGASFIITGEVVGQRPMSQMRGMLKHIERQAGVEGLVVRPLSAKLLPVTIAEEKGWIDREKLFDINGRGRKRQFEIAQEYGITDVPQPAGGCLLTDPIYAARIKDLISHKNLKADDINILRFGRYFRLGENSRVIVGRNERDNELLENAKKEGDMFFKSKDQIPGPSALGRGDFSDPAVLELALKLVARYFSKKEKNTKVKLELYYNNEVRLVETDALDEVQAKKYAV